MNKKGKNNPVVGAVTFFIAFLAYQVIAGGIETVDVLAAAVASLVVYIGASYIASKKK